MKKESISKSKKRRNRKIKNIFQEGNIEKSKIRKKYFKKWKLEGNISKIKNFSKIYSKINENL